MFHLVQASSTMHELVRREHDLHGHNRSIPPPAEADNRLAARQHAYSRRQSSGRKRKSFSSGDGSGGAGGAAAGGERVHWVFSLVVHNHPSALPNLKVTCRGRFQVGSRPKMKASNTAVGHNKRTHADFGPFMNGCKNSLGIGFGVEGSTEPLPTRARLRRNTGRDSCNLPTLHPCLMISQKPKLN